MRFKHVKTREHVCVGVGVCLCVWTLIHDDTSLNFKLRNQIVVMYLPPGLFCCDKSSHKSQIQLSLLLLLVVVVVVVVVVVL